MHRVRIVQVPVERLEDVFFSLKNLNVRVRAIRAIEKVRDRRGNNLLDFGGYEETCDADELKLSKRYHARGKEAINDVDGKKKSLRHQAEADVYLNEPVG